MRQGEGGTSVRFDSSSPHFCGLGGMADTLALGASAERHEGSSPSARTKTFARTCHKLVMETVLGA